MIELSKRSIHAVFQAKMAEKPHEYCAFHAVEHLLSSTFQLFKGSPRHAEPKTSR
jgi:hypothetical protein